MSEELTLDGLQGIDDPESERKVSESLLLPKGNYNTIPELSVTVAETKPEAKHPGRKYVRYAGVVVGSDPDNRDQKGFLRFNLSHEPVFFEDGKADGWTKLYKTAKDTYRRAMQLPKDAPVDRVDVLTFLSKYSVGLNVGINKSGDENTVWAIFPARV